MVYQLLRLRVRIQNYNTVLVMYRTEIKNLQRIWKRDSVRLWCRNGLRFGASIRSYSDSSLVTVNQRFGSILGLGKRLGSVPGVSKRFNSVLDISKRLGSVLSVGKRLGASVIGVGNNDGKMFGTGVLDRLSGVNRVKIGTQNRPRDIDDMRR